MGTTRDIGIGIVCDDKSDGSKCIMVYPQEQLPYFEGDITSAPVANTYSGKDKAGKAYKNTLYKTIGVKAMWLGDGNRKSSPCVVKGEQVRLYRVGDTQEYYWEEIGRDSHLRRTESVTYAYNARSTDQTIDQAPDSTNCYSFTIDGKNGHVTLSTTKANGEKAGFTLQANGKEGHFTIATDTGILIQLDTTTDSAIVTNKAGTTISAHDKNATVVAQFINLQAPKINMVGDLNIDGNLTGKKASFTEVDTPNLQAANNPT